MSKAKTEGKKTIWQLDQQRPPNCLNFGTRRECGKPAAINSGCKIGPCKENLEAAQQKAEVKAARAEAKAADAPRATPRRLKSYDSEAYLAQCARDNAVRAKGTLNENGTWVWHTEDCCRRVWRPVSFGCLTRTVG